MEATNVREQSAFAPPTHDVPNPVAPGKSSAAATVAIRTIGIYFLAYFLTGQVGREALPGVVLRVFLALATPLEWLDSRVRPPRGALRENTCRTIHGFPELFHQPDYVDRA